MKIKQANVMKYYEELYTGLCDKCRTNLAMEIKQKRRRGLCLKRSLKLGNNTIANICDECKAHISKMMQKMKSE